jgi:hypothetical protein
MTGGSTHLTADGDIWEVPYYPTSKPIKPNVRIRKAKYWQDELPAGPYEYRHNLNSGDGEYTLIASIVVSEDVLVTIATTGPRNGAMQSGNIFKILVPGASEAVLREAGEGP